MTREELVAKYVISEAGLQALVTDLLALPDDGYNCVILRDALNGTYSDYKSVFAMPQSQLLLKLSQPGYEALKDKALRGAYDHDDGARLLPGFKHPFGPRLFGKQVADKPVAEEEYVEIPSQCIPQ